MTHRFFSCDNATVLSHPGKVSSSCDLELALGNIPSFEDIVVLVEFTPLTND